MWKLFFRFFALGSLPLMLGSFLLTTDWKFLIGDIQYEATTRAADFYRENRPEVLDRFAAGLARQPEDGATVTANVRKPCLNYPAQVVKVTDGDTLVVRDRRNLRHTIRLRGIDAPERNQDFGDRAEKFLASCVLNKNVIIATCESDRIYKKREIALVTLGTEAVIGDSGESVNLTLIGAGMAHYYKDFSANLPPAERMLYAEREDRARRDKSGLWANPHPLLPKDFRRSEKKSN